MVLVKSVFAEYIQNISSMFATFFFNVSTKDALNSLFYFILFPLSISNGDCLPTYRIMLYMEMTA